ncbi:MAG: cytochrome c oxidase subunit 3 family protein [Acidobacteriota bacterium]
MSTTTPDLQTPGGHGHDSGHGDHSPFQQHHFTTMEQQFDTSKVGMWTFLATEVLMFGGLFVGFGISQGKYPQEFVDAHHHLQRWAGALNTIVLLISSWTMVMAVNAAQTNQKSKMKMYLLLTIACACIFMGVKYYEYSHKFEEGLLPGMFYHAQATDSVPGSHGYPTFFAFYFMMTGLHGIHILIGIGLLTWLYLKSDNFSSAYYTPVDLIGLYWHIVDMIWIYLFPLYYLIS